MRIEENKMPRVSTVNSKSQLKIDLHSHTLHSDGQLSPTELVQRAHNMQLDVLSITDHDSIDGLKEAHAYQAQQKRPLSIVNGIELSTRWHGFDIHIVGLNVDVANQQFRARIEQQHETRKKRAEKIAHKLTISGFTQARNVLHDRTDEQITRSHFAHAMVTAGFVKDHQQAFKQYLGKGKRAFVAPHWITIIEAIEWIHDAGGQAVLAHPTHYDMTTKWLRRLVAEFAAATGDGIEVNYPNLTSEKQKLLLEMAELHELKGSVGSDFHYPSRWTELGRRSSIPDEIKPIWHDWPIASPITKAQPL